MCVNIQYPLISFKNSDLCFSFLCFCCCVKTLVMLIKEITFSTLGSSLPVLVAVSFSLCSRVSLELSNGHSYFIALLFTLCPVFTRHLIHDAPTNASAPSNNHPSLPAVNLLLPGAAGLCAPLNPMDGDLITDK